METWYKKLKQYILSSYDLSSLTASSQKCGMYYDMGRITKREYRNLMSLIDYIVIKGCKCERIGL